MYQKFGARPLNRAIQKYIEDPLAEEIIQKTVSEGDSITIDLDAKKQEIQIKQKKKRKAKKEEDDNNNQSK